MHHIVENRIFSYTMSRLLTLCGRRVTLQTRFYNSLNQLYYR